MKQLQEENLRLKQLVAELTLDKAMLQDVLSKKWESLRGVDRWWSIWQVLTKSVSDMRAGFYAWQELRIAIAAIWIHGLSCGCVSAKSLRQECATGTVKSAHC